MTIRTASQRRNHETTRTLSKMPGVMIVPTPWPARSSGVVEAKPQPRYIVGRLGERPYWPDEL